MRFGQRRRKRFENPQLGQQGAAVVHVELVFAGPVESLAGENLQAVQLNAMPAVELDVSFREIFTDDANKFYRAEKAGGNCRVARGTAEQTRVFGFWGFNRIKGGRTNDQYTHANSKLPV